MREHPPLDRAAVEARAIALQIRASELVALVEVIDERARDLVDRRIGSLLGLAVAAAADVERRAIALHALAEGTGRRGRTRGRDKGG